MTETGTAPARRPPWLHRDLPWTVAGVATAAALLAIGVLVAQPVHARPAAATTPVGTPSPSPTATDTSIICRDQAGQLVSSMSVPSQPGDKNDVWCVLDVAGHQIEVHAQGGEQGISVWARAATR